MLLADARDCYDIQQLDPSAASGVHNVTPAGGSMIEVYCDMTTAGGGWTVSRQSLQSTSSQWCR